MIRLCLADPEKTYLVQNSHKSCEHGNRDLGFCYNYNTQTINYTIARLLCQVSHAIYTFSKEVSRFQKV